MGKQKPNLQTTGKRLVVSSVVRKSTAGPGGSKLRREHRPLAQRGIFADTWRAKKGSGRRETRATPVT